MIYATGGVAFLGTNQTVSAGFPINGYTSASSTRVGWTVGGGLEYAVTNNWSIRAVYRYAQFGTSNIYANGGGPTVLGAIGAYANRKITENRVQVGFSYKFDWLRRLRSSPNTNYRRTKGSPVVMAGLS